MSTELNPRLKRATTHVLNQLAPEHETPLIGDKYGRGHQVAMRPGYTPWEKRETPTPKLL